MTFDITSSDAKNSDGSGRVESYPAAKGGVSKRLWRDAVSSARYGVPVSNMGAMTNLSRETHSMWAILNVTVA